MSKPRVLLVDDSEAVLAFATAALTGHFSLRTAVDGRQALAQLELEAPHLIVLDLSMPHMNGEEVLAHVMGNPRLAQVPVLVVSSEGDRARACVGRGARAFLPKPLRADDLLSMATRLVEQEREARRRGSLACLPLRVGAVEMAVALDAVDVVLPQVETQPLAFGPPYLREVFDMAGEAVFSLDLAVRLGVEHAAQPVDRKLVVLRQQELRLALCVDDVRDPEEVGPENVVGRDLVGGAEHGELRDALVAVIRTPRGPIPVVEPRAFMTPELLDPLAAWLGTRQAGADDVLEASWD